jgi:hypothetical protein
MRAHNLRFTALVTASARIPITLVEKFTTRILSQESLCDFFDLPFGQLVEMVWKESTIDFLNYLGRPDFEKALLRKTQYNDEKFLAGCKLLIQP